MQAFTKSPVQIEIRSPLQPVSERPDAKQARALALIEQAAAEHGEGLVVSTSFGIHSAAILHLATRIVPDEIAERYEGGALVAKVNVDEEPDLVQQHGIRTIPSFLFVRDGEVVDRASGVLTRARLDARIDALLAAPEGPREPQTDLTGGETK